ncbi:MAG: hypothetical protein WBN88_06120, partial [Anderseniella sp.]
MSKAATAGKFSAQRAAYEKDTLNSLRRTLKGSGWRKSGNDLFRSVHNLFLNADIRVHSDAFKS